MKNVTVSLPDEIYRRAELKAAERATSVSDLVRDLLVEIATDENDFECRKRLQDGVIASIREFRAGDRVTRDEVHGRTAVRGHERPALRHQYRSDEATKAHAARNPFLKT